MLLAGFFLALRDLGARVLVQVGSGWPPVLIRILQAAQHDVERPLGDHRTLTAFC